MTRSSTRRSTHGPAAAVAAALLLLAAACGNDDADAQEREDLEEEGHDLPASPEDAETAADLAALDLTLTEVAAFEAPIDLVSREGDEALFVAEQAGRVFRVEVTGEGTDRTYSVDETPVVDISDEVVSGGEQGLLGIAFSPDGERLYLHYSLADSGATRVISYEYIEDSAPEGDTSDGETSDGEAEEATAGVDLDSRKEIFAEEQPYPNHNGGQILFGPDGYLYVGLGDGGDGGDPHGNGQDTSTLLGSILRIDPESSVGTDEPYLIPEDNPFADGDGGAPEIWLYGVRNPWRFSFDAVTGDLWIGDVGQNEWEEIDRLPATGEDGEEQAAGRGANLGWNEMEGSHPFDGGENPADGILPVYEYPIQDETDCAVVGGQVYSGAAIPDLDGVYLFGDACNPQVRALSVQDGQVTEATPLESVQVDGLATIAQDADHELYLLSLFGEVFRLDP
jgi:glucose/arabinose dehydrogenase